jgi:hypothetical protein
MYNLLMLRILTIDPIPINDNIFDYLFEFQDRIIQDITYEYLQETFRFGEDIVFALRLTAHMFSQMEDTVRPTIDLIGLILTLQLRDRFE